MVASMRPCSSQALRRPCTTQGSYALSHLRTISYVRENDRQRACAPSARKRSEWESRRPVPSPPRKVDEVSVLESVAVDDLEITQLKPISEAYDRLLGKHWRALPARYKIVLATSLSFMICNMDKVNMSVAIIPMSQEFGWSSSVAGLVQSSFFWGYLLVQLPGGYLASRFGGRYVLPAAVTTWSAATALVPPLASTIPSLCASRALVGLGEGAAPSAATDMIVRVVPNTERSRAVSIVFGGLHVGSIFGLLAAPLLIGNLGWEAVFYIFGGAGLFWAFWFQSILRDPSPDMVALQPALRSNEETTGEATTIPWRAFVRNGPVRTLMFTHFCHNWCHYTMLAWLPSYFKDALSMDLTHASAAALFPPIASIIVSSVTGQVADHYISKGVKVAHVRKAAQCTAFLIPAACLVGASYTEGTYWSVAFISAALGLSSFSLSGLYCTHQDISPKYASALLGLTNTSGSIPGIIGVAAVGSLLDVTHSWSVALFAPIILFFVLGSGVYTLHSRSELQDFSDDTPFEWENRLRALLPGGGNGR